jgi:hypothetical protein
MTGDGGMEERGELALPLGKGGKWGNLAFIFTDSY